jgi:hypothetical protein
MAPPDAAARPRGPLRLTHVRHVGLTGVLTPAYS